MWAGSHETKICQNIEYQKPSMDYTYIENSANIDC